MNCSKNINFIPTKRSNQTEISYLRELQSLSNIPRGPKKPSRTKGTICKIGNDTFRIISGINKHAYISQYRDPYISQYRDEVARKGTLLAVPLNGIGFMRFIRKQQIQDKNL